MRDSNGKILCLFSCFLVSLDSNIAELLAIKHAIELISNNTSFANRETLVVSDSKTAVSWVNEGEFGNLAHVQTIFEIRGMLLEAENIKVVFDLRIFNSLADSLAKMGSSETGDFVVWGDV